MDNNDDYGFTRIQRKYTVIIFSTSSVVVWEFVVVVDNDKKWVSM